MKQVFPKKLLTAAVLFSVGILSSYAFATDTTDAVKPRNTLNKPVLLADYGGNQIHRLDKAGNVVWQYPAKRPQDVWMLPDGNVLFSHVKGATIVTPEKEVVWSYETDPKNEVHACQPLPDGLILVAESGPMQIIEIDRDGKIVKTVKLKTGTENTHAQMRCVRKLPNGNYTVGQYYDNIVREYDTDGNIVREIPQKEAFSGIRLPNGNTLIAAGDSHKLLEIDANDRVVWEVTENDLPGNPLRFVGGLQRLASGNTLICNWGGHGHVGQQPQIIEITPEKKVVGELFDFEQFNTISGIMLLETDADPTKFEVLR